MNTPIHDFVKAYASSAPVRLHMPGHKGRGPLGCEERDLTEIPGADSLYEASGVIAESEANASRLFGCPTFYSTEGSSHCIRAMLQVAREACHGNREQGTGNRERESSFRVLAARNVHRAFLSAAALLDLDVVWLPQAADSYLSAAVTPEALDAALAESGAQAVYLTCPDYLGFLPDLRPLARVCHARGALLLVDNAHGAYLRFLSPSRHPMDLGADLCCDSAHKTLPVLTGGAYLHVKGTGNREQGTGDGRREGTGNRERGTGDGRREGTGSRQQAAEKAVRDALALFGSSSPSYLVLQSLDLANPWLEALPAKLAAFLPQVEALKARLRAAGWKLVGDEPLKLTICCHSQPCPEQSRRGSEESVSSAVGSKGEAGPSAALRSAQDDRLGGGLALAAALEQAGIFCEFADPDFVVFMLSPQNTAEELDRLERALTGREALVAPVIAGGNDAAGTAAEASGDASLSAGPKAVCSLREALLSPCELVPAGESPGRVLARPGVSCPPAVPILMPGERIDEAAAAAFARYGIRTVAVLPRRTTNTDS